MPNRLCFFTGLGRPTLRSLQYPMLAEWSVELGADDPQLEIPWSSADGRVRYLDLKRQPELLLEVPEACDNLALAEFLNWANSAESVFETVKCDSWSSDEITPEEEFFGEPCKFGSYVDLLFTAESIRAKFLEHELFIRNLASLLSRAPEMPASAELIVRRCTDRRSQSRNREDCFYTTLYVHGYGEDEQRARERWEIALKMVQHAMVQQRLQTGKPHAAPKIP